METYYQAEIYFLSNPRFVCYDPPGWTFGGVQNGKSRYIGIFSLDMDLDTVITKSLLTAGRISNSGHSLLSCRLDKISSAEVITVYSYTWD